MEEDLDGQRVDNFLARELKGVPRTHLYRILRRGEVRVNGKRVKPSSRLQAGDLVRIPPVRYRQPLPDRINSKTDIEKTIAYEDKLMLIVNKPPGLAVHGGSGLSYGVIELLRQSRPNENLELAHRLDRDTSGLLVVAKRRSFLRHFHQLLREPKSGMVKRYMAVVVGDWPSDLTEIRAPIEKNTVKSGERRSRVHADGKSAETRFRKVNSIPLAQLVPGTTGNLSLLEAELVTGRTHQVRVHCHWAGHPILGDDKYQSDQWATVSDQLRGVGYRRLMLHALALKIPMAQGTDIKVSAPAGGSMAALVNALDGNSGQGI